MSHQDMGNGTIGRRLSLLAWCIVCLGGMLMLLAPGARAHKFHASLAEVEYNEGERRLEIAVRLFPDDLEEALGRQAGRRVRLDSAQNVDELILDYMRQRFAVTPAGGAPLRLGWVGKEITVNAVWVYLQAESPAGLAGARLRNEVFLELFADQVNTVNLREGRRSATLVFKRGEAEKSVGW